MNNHRFPVMLIVVLAIFIAPPLVRPAYAQYAVFDATNNGVLVAIQAIQAAIQQFNQFVQDAIGSANAKIASSLADHLKKQQAAQSDEALGAAMVGDRQKEFENSQNASKEAAQKNGDAALVAIMKYQADQNDCINITNATVREYQERINLQRSGALIKSDMNDTAKGRVISSTISDIAQKIALAKQQKDSTDPDVIKYQGDKSIVLAHCPDSDCYNKWVDQQMTTIFQVSAGGPPATNAKTNNPLVNRYMIQRGAWERRRSEARLKASTIAADILYKSMSNYLQALNVYQTYRGLSPADAAKALAGDHQNIAGQFPYADIVGLTGKELDEATYTALRKATSGVTKDQLDKARLNYEADKIEEQEHLEALEIVATPAPTLPANAYISTQQGP